MNCPTQVQKAIERIQLEIYTKTDEKLVSAWVQWCVQHESEMNDTEKEWETPAKRQRNSADELQHCIAK